MGDDPQPNGEERRQTRLTRSRIKALLADHELTPSRALGQNFLCEPDLVDKIVRLADVSPGDNVVEIGPGLGSLTVGLLDAGARVVAVEADRRLAGILAGSLGQSPDLEVVNADALALDWSRHLGDVSWKVVANLPYNISAPLVLDLLAEQHQMTSLLVMVQREVGERLVALPGDSDVGIPSLLRAYWADGRVVGRVPAEVFHPRPRVESVLVRLDRHPPALDVDFETFAALVRAGFGKRRKMLRQSLAAHLSAEDIAGAGIDPTLRAERVRMEEWGQLAAALEVRNPGGVDGGPR